ncbi:MULTISPECIES: peroxiredoxin-like family protein [Crateriforma]|uniref:thioredoxin-dependent peroxiredoxin n=1 Tax=Crateriforma conspicua TaxID=2527996 RepID=A0A5C6FUI8_9PLAN|nr:MULTISPECIES: peroxiredoxin-like family protein [Crateriforma]TWU66647.1 putative peroxiredoxin bcp [Crateriforma conspicua]
MVSHVSADDPTALSVQLQKTADDASKRFPAEVLESFQAGIESVRATGIEQSAKQVGDSAADATLKGWDDQSVTLSEVWQNHPVILMWYRGGWCPYCNLQLRAMQKQLSAIEGAGAKLVVLTPELPEKAKETAEANDLDMLVLHDANNELAKKFGILFQLPDVIVPIYRDKLELAKYNGNDAMELPLSATYVIDTDGKITYAFLDADYKKRAEPAEVVAAVKQLQ